MAGLYLHIPFCHSKCAYCDFFSTPKRDRVDVYLDALIREFDWRQSEINEPFTTLYLGGGTPSILSPRQLQKLTAALPLDNIVEATIEANPEDINSEFLSAIKACGFNRLSIGIQSLEDQELKAVGRRHSAAQAIDAVKAAQNAGIQNISIDIIFGLPLQTLSSLAQTISQAIALDPTHISVYCLMYEPGTRLTAMRNSGKIQETSPEILEQMYQYICDTLSRAGYSHYEISNFAKEGHESLHNSSYWNSTPYLGLGVAAHSFDGLIRRFNPISISDYIKATAPVFVVDEETDDQRHNDYVMVALRTARGINLADYESRYGSQSKRWLLSSARRHINAGSIIANDSTIRIAESAWLISDSIIPDLFR